MSDESTTHAGPGNPAAQDALLPGVKHIIAVASGKGGVGKSTVSTNLSVALAQTGAKVGLMDADIYGPNIPMMMGVPKPPEKEGDKIKPAEAHGVQIISMGFFVPEETAIVWRGPMVHTAIQQFFRDVLWGELDYLLVDLPPGTGDAQLSLSQIVPLTGVVTVTTPQEVALYDVRKGMMMFKKVNVPLLGVIENMSFLSAGIAENERRFSRLRAANVRRKNSRFLSWVAFPWTLQSARVAMRVGRSSCRIRILRSPKRSRVWQRRCKHA